ncbi:MAG TPA: helix-hairpin-helix domain-containing protein [Pyrinomonadaceae bacterium]|nr:helix-hairpin-helix domain-containing protein [Pyrinomonadaceae bacterium]
MVNQRFRRPGRLLTRRTRLFLSGFLCHALALASLPACVKLPHRATLASVQTTSEPTRDTRATALININTASREELERLPGIGRGLAARIVEHRERHGAFRRVEHLIIVRGISERRFAELRAHITAD